MVEYNPSLMRRLVTSSPSKEYFQNLYPDIVSKYNILIDKMGVGEYPAFVIYRRRTQ